MDREDYFSPAIYGRKVQFCGSGPPANTHVLLDAEEFRRYLNRFFLCGETEATRTPDPTPTNPQNTSIHWTFKETATGITYDSVDLDHQPYGVAPTWDTHCTMFSLFYEVKISRVHKLPIGNLVSCYGRSGIFSEFKYLQNIEVLYKMLELLFKYKPFTTYCNAFRPWRAWGNWASRPAEAGVVNYGNLAADQVVAVAAFRDRIMRDQTCRICPQVHVPRRIRNRNVNVLTARRSHCTHRYPETCRLCVNQGCVHTHGYFTCNETSGTDAYFSSL